MSVRDRIEDSRLLINAGKLEGALISILLAVAATSRKRYPRATGMLDREAFVQFLCDERNKITSGKAINIEFCGNTNTLENILYKFVRNCLIHEAELDDHVSFEYGDFLLDKRGTTDYFTFSSELVIRLAYAVETATENKGLFPDGLYDQLPEPVDLKRTAIIKFKCGEQEFEGFFFACSIREEIWKETGEKITWLHLKGRQSYGGQLGDNPEVKLLVPTKYVTSIENGPNFIRSKKRLNLAVGVFPPNNATPHHGIPISEIKNRISELQIPLVATTLTIYRPHYDLVQEE